MKVNVRKGFTRCPKCNEVYPAIKKALHDTLCPAERKKLLNRLHRFVNWLLLK